MSNYRFHTDCLLSPKLANAFAGDDRARNNNVAHESIALHCRDYKVVVTSINLNDQFVRFACNNLEELKGFSAKVEKHYSDVFAAGEIVDTLETREIPCPA